MKHSLFEINNTFIQYIGKDEEDVVCAYRICLSCIQSVFVFSCSNLTVDDGLGLVKKFYQKVSCLLGSVVYMLFVDSINRLLFVSILLRNPVNRQHHLQLTW